MASHRLVFVYWPLGTKFCEILIKIQQFSLTKNKSENNICKMATIFRSLNVLIQIYVC